MTTQLLEEPPVSADERITRAEAARRLGVSVATIDRYAADGLLDRQRNQVTRRVTFSAKAVEDLRRRREG